MRAWVPLTHVPSGWTEPLGLTASEVLPSDNIPPQFFSQEEGNTMALALPGRQARVPSTPLPSDQLELLRPTASKSEPSDYTHPPLEEENIYIPPLVFVQEGNTMALALPGRQARVPSTLVPSGCGDALVPTASEVQPSDYIPPPSIVRREENISCSPGDLILGRRFP